MQVVINIDDTIYKRVMVYKGEQFPDNDDLLGALITAVANGTPLPKGHGRLIDADALVKKMEEREEKLKDDRSMWETAGVETALDMYAKTIIEADESEEI